MEHNITIRHIQIRLKSKYEDFTLRLANALGKLDRSVMNKISSDPAAAAEELRDEGGLENLMLYSQENEGEEMRVRDDPKKAWLFELGNPLIAAEMMALDIRAGLYHPLRLLVFIAEDNRLYVEYDLPSTLFGQFNRNGITQMGEMLDTKMKNLIDIVDRNEPYKLADQVF